MSRKLTMSQYNELAFKPHLTNNDLEVLMPVQRGTVMTMRQVDPDHIGHQLRERVAGLLPSENLFGENSCRFTTLYQELRNHFNKRGAALPPHSSQRTVRTFANGLYTEPEKRDIANLHAIDILKGQSSRPNPMTTTDGHDTYSQRIEPYEKLAHNVAMRRKDHQSKFRGDTTEPWDEYVETYNLIAKDYRFSDEQKLQFLHNTLTKDALRSYRAKAAPHVTTYEQ